MTNINDALLQGLESLESFSTSNSNSCGKDIVMFLTDGEPTAGETNK